MQGELYTGGKKMQENENGIIEGQDTDYINAINDLKANSVPKEQYEKLKADNKRLLDSLTQGTQLEQPIKKRTDEELYNIINSESTNNLDYCKAMCELRNNALDRGEVDPAMPKGHNYQYNQADQDVVDKVFNVIEECIEYADGDSLLFTNELMRRTNDTPAIVNNRAKNRR